MDVDKWYDEKFLVPSKIPLCYNIHESKPVARFGRKRNTSASGKELTLYHRTKDVDMSKLKVFAVNILNVAKI